MIFLPMDQLKVGMELAEEVVVYYRGPLVLLHKGARLTERYLGRMRQFDVGGAYIEDGVNSDVVPPKPLVTKELRAEAVFRVKDIYASIESGSRKVTTQKIAKMDDVVNRLRCAISNCRAVMVDIADLKSYDDCTYRHSLSVAVIALAIGLHLRMERRELQELGLCALLHDVGKVEVPLSILNKPGRLTDDEFSVIKMHPDWGAEYLLENGLVSQAVVDGVRHHHERLDGYGYPTGLHGIEIPLYSRIITVADVYDALTATRPYRRPIQPSEAAEYLMGNCNTCFDQKIVEAFLQSVQMYPIGSCVSLSNGQKCVVINNRHALRPKVRMLEEPYTELDLFEDSALYNTVIAFSYHSVEEMREAQEGGRLYDDGQLGRE